MKRAGSILAVLVVLAGCATLAQDERARYLAAQEVFTATVEGLAELREAGAFTQAEADRITAAIRAGKEGLLAWGDALLRGETGSEARAAVYEAIATLSAYRRNG